MLKIARDIVLCTMIASAVSMAGDDPSDGAYIENQSMPALKPGEYGTDEDNENNSLTGVADGDMDTYIYNTNSVHPIEFNIIIDKPVGNLGAVLKMNVYDVDIPDEVDDVYINHVKIGTLTGANNQWGVNRMTVPPGILKQGKNLVQVFVDQNNTGAWATEIDYAILSGLSAKQGGILKCWVAPTKVQAGDIVNFFAEISGNPTKVQLYNGDAIVPKAILTDPDGDKVYSVQYKIPKYMGGANRGLKDSFKIRAAGPWGVSWCPGVKVTK